MRLPLSTPEEIADEPELAPLEILSSAVEVSRRALLAAHPELKCRVFVGEEPEISPLSRPALHARSRPVFLAETAS